MENYKRQPVFLYDGFAGVALFLSALVSITDDPDIKRLNEATIQSLKRSINSAVENPDGDSLPGIRVEHLIHFE